MVVTPEMLQQMGIGQLGQGMQLGQAQGLQLGQGMPMGQAIQIGGGMPGLQMGQFPGGMGMGGQPIPLTPEMLNSLPPAQKQQILMQIQQVQQIQQMNKFQQNGGQPKKDE